jgi:hypothetical protein
MIISLLRKISKGRVQNFYRALKYNISKKSLIFRASNRGLANFNSDEKLVIVSLTSFSLRLKDLHLCIKSLLQQSYKPNKLILWLGNDVDVKDIPDSLISLKKFGLEIIIKNENLGSHKKYFYAMQEFPRDIIITVDDDYIYDRHLVRDLMRAHQKNKIAICTLVGWRMVFDRKLGNLLHRGDWLFEKKILANPSHELFIRGPYTLYPPNSLDRRVFDIDTIKRFCQNGENGVIGYDDSWLKCMATLKSSKVINARKFKILFDNSEIISSQVSSLGADCIGDNYEGVKAQELFNFFGLNDNDFKDKKVV